VDLLQDAERAQRDVLEIADRGRDEIELAYPTGAFGAYGALLPSKIS
jgi:hypothetical protein